MIRALHNGERVGHVSENLKPKDSEILGLGPRYFNCAPVKHTGTKSLAPG